jgi:hypothetical protein
VIRYNYEIKLKPLLKINTSAPRLAQSLNTCSHKEITTSDFGQAVTHANTFLCHTLTSRVFFGFCWSMNALSTLAFKTPVLCI